MTIVVHTGGTRREMKVRVGKVKVTLFLRTGGYMASRSLLRTLNFQQIRKRKMNRKFKEVQNSTDGNPSVTANPLEGASGGNKMQDRM